MKKNLKFIICIFISVILFLVSFLLFYKSMNNYTQDIVSYRETSNVDYKVYLKENSYFDTPYLGEDKVYITSLIDYIDVDFFYNMSFDDNISGKYVYYIKGFMSANVSNTVKDYWQKSYDMVKLKEVEYESTKNINFSENIKIDYKKYNDLLLQFKEDYKLSMDGSFKLVLYVENYVKSNDDYLLKPTVTSLEIPLTKATIEVPIEVDEVSSSDNLYGELIYGDNKVTLIYRVMSGVTLLIGLVLLCFAIFKIVRSLEKISLYNKELRKILKTYDGIIVSVKELPNRDTANVIDVDSFNELLDAHGEIRQPISYYETRKRATFILINGNVMWRYILRDRDYES